jgi:hypothetical protein
VSPVRPLPCCSPHPQPYALPPASTLPAPRHQRRQPAIDVETLDADRRTLTAAIEADWLSRLLRLAQFFRLILQLPLRAIALPVARVGAPSPHIFAVVLAPRHGSGSRFSKFEFRNSIIWKSPAHCRPSARGAHRLREPAFEVWLQFFVVGRAPRGFPRGVLNLQFRKNFRIYVHPPETSNRAARAHGKHLNPHHTAFPQSYPQPQFLHLPYPSRHEVDLPRRKALAAPGWRGRPSPAAGQGKSSPATYPRAGATPRSASPCSAKPKPAPRSAHGSATPGCRGTARSGSP